MLEVEEIHTFYGPSHVLQGVSLTVREGEVVCLLGRNGAGKTTTLRSIIGLTPPRHGSVRFLGRELTGWHPYRVARMGIGYVDQGRRIFPSLSVDENLEVAENGRKGSWTKAEVYRVFPELVPLRSRLGRHLSGGEQQILAIGRALMGNPVLLLCDEPSEGLAPLLVRRLGALLREVAGRGLAVLLAEQNLRFALDLAHRGYIIDKARIRLEGPAELLREEEIVRRHLAL
ncbi:MAG: ABC transporter ATP-binding protein [candidate division NC10 bacterium]|nr:ABC transporter ATP-binding protein [candidate division NC10 bacterium]